MRLGEFVARFVFPPDGFTETEFQKVVAHIERIAAQWGMGVETVKEETA